MNQSAPPIIRQVLASSSLTLLVLTPLLTVIGNNISRLPLPPSVLWRSVLGVIVVANVTIWCAQRVTGRRLSSLPDWALATLLFLAMTWTGLAFWPAMTMVRAPESAYRAVDAIIARTLNVPRRPVSPDRDIYLIVLDALGAPDILASRYGVDVSGVITSLETRGFMVATRSKSAYPYTFQSLASTLNFEYLDTLAAEVDPSVPDLHPLLRLIHRNALFQLAREAGYRVVMIGSDFSTTDRAPLADHCYCRQPVPHLVEHAAMATVPGFQWLLPIDRWAHAAHRSHLDGVLRELRRHPDGRRQFVMAHVLAPHPPFVYGADGPRIPSEPFSFSGPHDLQQWKREYRSQAQFVLHQIVNTVDELLARGEPRPVILIQGDHGPNVRQSGYDPDVEERFGIFFAALFPNRSVELSDGISPLNAARALATSYLGVDLAPLPDSQWSAEEKRPYALTRADDAEP